MSQDAAMQGKLKDLITALGENTEREGLKRTPERAWKALQFLTSGYKTDIRKIVNGALFEEKYNNMVVVKNIELFSMCEHHMLPFYGKAHVAYIPNGKIIGLSKIPRIVDAFARRLQVQERLTEEVANVLMEILNPLGVAVVIEANHMCMMMRGLEKQNSYTITSSMRGVFHDDASTRSEFMDFIKRELKA
jgi:GTP cyclohydrolase I